MPVPLESDWVRQAAAGDRKAFGHLVDRYWDKVRRWLVGLTGKEHQAEDIAQDAFLKAWIALPTFRETASFRPWIFQIARRCWLDACRRSDVRKQVALPEDVPDRPSSPLGAMVFEEAQHQVRTALESLPPNYRAAYLLFVEEELPYAEIAEILGVSEENARWRVFRARQNMLHKLTPYLTLP